MSGASLGVGVTIRPSSGFSQACKGFRAAAPKQAGGGASAPAGEARAIKETISATTSPHLVRGVLLLSMRIHRHTTWGGRFLGVEVADRWYWVPSDGHGAVRGLL